MNKPKTFPTRNDISQERRKSLITLLNQQLADTFDLYSQVKQAHWNVKGPQFIQLHELFDKLAENLEEPVDMLAERITALGGVALGTIRLAAQQSRLSELPPDDFDGLILVKALADSYAVLAASTRAAIDEANENNDAASSDLFTEIVRELDKSLWFLEAHLLK